MFCGGHRFDNVCPDATRNEKWKTKMVPLPLAFLFSAEPVCSVCILQHIANVRAWCPVFYRFSPLIATTEKPLRVALVKYVYHPLKSVAALPPRDAINTQIATKRIPRDHGRLICKSIRSWKVINCAHCSVWIRAVCGKNVAIGKRWKCRYLYFICEV